MRFARLAGVLWLLMLALGGAEETASAAAAAPAYDLDGVWAASAIGCNGRSEGRGTVQISGWNSSSGVFAASVVIGGGETKSGSGVESGTTIRLTILSVAGAKG